MSASLEVEVGNEEKFQDEAYQGKPFPVQYGSRGPKDSDQCTDIICLVFFLLYVIGMIAIVIVLRPTAHIDEMRNVMDSEGNHCGKDAGFEDYPNLMFFKFTPKFRSVCVKACPKFDYNQIKFNSTGTATDYIQPVYFSNFSAAVKASAEPDAPSGDAPSDEPVPSGGRILARHLQDGPGPGPEGPGGEPPAGGDEPSAENQEQDTSIFEFDEKAAQGYYTQEQWDAYVGNFNLECKSNGDVSSCANNPGEKNYLYDARSYVGDVCTPVAPKITSSLGGFGDLSSAFEDLRTTMWPIIGSIVVALLISMIILFVTKIFIGCLIWFLIVLAILFSFAISVFCFMILYFSSQVGFIAEYAESAGPQAAHQYQKIAENKKVLLWVGIVSLLIGIVLIVLIIVKRKAISVAAGVIEVAADYIFDHPTLFVITILSFILQIGTFITCLYGILVIHTNGEFHIKDNGSPFPAFKYDPKKWALLVYFGIGTYWVSIFWNNVSDFTVAASAVDDYFKKEVGTFGEFCKAFTVHLGTVAFGSLVLLPIGIFNTLFGWIHALIRDDKPNAMQNFFGKLCCICCWPYEKFCLRIDDGAFAMVALTQLNFCQAGRKEFYLGRRVGSRIGDAKIIGFIYNLAGRIGISGLTTWISYLIFTRVEYFSLKIHNPLVPTGAVLLASIVVSHLVMNMFSEASGATLMCYLVQLDTGNKPNYSELDETIKRINDGYDKLD